MKYARIILAIVLITSGIIVLNLMNRKGPYLAVAGFTQGTSYHITYSSPGPDTLDLQSGIDSLLRNFDLSLSTYIDSSLISKINRNETDSVDSFFLEVYREAKRINNLTSGAFDITVGPLIDAWGFGPGVKMDMNELIVDSLVQFTGMDKIKIENGRLIKSDPRIRLDVNAIAQGYAVDVLVSWLKSNGVRNYMVEIGGEIRCSGKSPRGDLWKVGIDRPDFNNMFPGQELQEIVSFSGKALASSGNYRKFYEVDGKKIVHTIDPRTGYTKMSNLLSVTIIADQCITADAIATSCMVIGLDASIDLIEKLSDTEALLIYSDDSGNYQEWRSPGMEKMIR